MRRSPPDSTTASMSAARLRGRNTTMSPFPEVSCESPGRRTVPPEAGPASGLIQAVMVPPAVAARTVPATRVRQKLPALDSTSIGPDTYMMRMPPPPVCARTEPRTSPKSIWPPPVRTLTKLPAWPTVILPPSVCKAGAPADLAGANVATAAMQRSVARNISGVDVAAGGKSRQVARDVEHVDVPAFGFQLGHGPIGSSTMAADTDAPRADVSALRQKAGKTPDVLRLDVARFRFDLDVVIERHADFKQHPVLRSRICGTGHLRRQRSSDLHARGRCFSDERVTIEKTLSQRGARIGFDVHRVLHNRRGVGIERNYFDGAEVSDEPQRQSLGRWQGT